MEKRWRLTARRKALGYSQMSLARAVGCDRNTVSRWELGLNDVAPHHREPLREALSTPESPLTAIDLEALLNGSSSDEIGVSGDSRLTMFARLEQTASSIKNYEPTVIPGLLQTEAYARSVTSNPEIVAWRLERQRALRREPNPLQLAVVVDEVAMLRVAGSEAIMSEQRHHLVTMATEDNVSVGVIPIASGQHSIGFGAFQILGGIGRGIVYTEHRTGSVYLESIHDVDKHAELFDYLVSLSLPVKELVEQ